MSNYKLSIIIPVYNCEEYIEECINSVIKQEINNNYEIILVDDGSSDNSGRICDEYAEKYFFISTIHKKNGGASSARNLGIKHSRGEYLMFIDSDDFIYCKANLQDIINSLKKDITQYRYLHYYDSFNKYTSMNKAYYYDGITYNDFLNYGVQNSTFSISPCDKIVRRSIIVDNNIFFTEGIVAEDIDWSFRVYMHATTIDYIDDEVYAYRQHRNGSVTFKPSTKAIESLLFILKKWINYNYNDISFKSLFYNYLAYQYIILLTIINNKNCTKKNKREIYELKFILKYDKNRKVRLSNKLFSIFGLRIGSKLLKIYIYLKNKGILKI